jgi:hypothetical protein
MLVEFNRSHLLVELVPTRQRRHRRRPGWFRGRGSAVPSPQVLRPQVPLPWCPVFELLGEILNRHKRVSGKRLSGEAIQF